MERSATNTMRVLIADDQKGVGTSLAALVTECEHEVVEVVGSGFEAIQAYHRLRPDVVLMDYYMPRLNGATACRNILSRYPGANVILVSGVVEAEDISNSGASAVLAKPVNLEKLRAALSATSLPLNGAPAAHTP
jgi:two-component system chemotaxis response regulator CheY